jgi:hypothetical protein
MDSLQDWRWMMRLVLAPKPMEGIDKKKLLKSQDRKSGKNTLKIKKIKNISAEDSKLFDPKTLLY